MGRPPVTLHPGQNLLVQVPCSTSSLRFDVWVPHFLHADTTLKQL